LIVDIHKAIQRRLSFLPLLLSVFPTILVQKCAKNYRISTERFGLSEGFVHHGFGEMGPKSLPRIYGDANFLPMERPKLRPSPGEPSIN